VRRSILMVSLLLGAVLIVADMPAAVRSSRYYRQPAREPDNGYDLAEEPGRPVRMTSRITRPEFLGDSNSVTGRVKEFEGLGESLDKVSTAAQQESREWMRVAIEERIRLAEVVQEQALEEFSLIRELATNEGAKETVAAIDGILLERDERYRTMVTRMEERLRRMRAGERGRIDPRASRRGARSRYRDEGRYGDQYNQRRGHRGQERYEDPRYYRQRNRYEDNYRYEDRYRGRTTYRGRVTEEQPEEEQTNEKDSKTRE